MIVVTQVSVRDIAARTGVSFQTVSKVLNGKGAVSEQTRQRILATADELGYVPNALARGLITQVTRTIGVVASDFVAPFVIGAEREARSQQQSVLISHVDRHGSNGEHILRTLLERRVDGILMAAPELRHNPKIGELLRGKVPTVSIHPLHGDGISVVSPDHFETGLLATQHLVALGHRRIGMITGPKDRPVTETRLAAYYRVLSSNGIGTDTSLVEEGSLEAEGGYQATHRLLDRAPDLTAIFAQNDTIAVGVLSALHQRGIHVPLDCAVVGCDDMSLAAHMVPPLTTVHVPIYETGETAMRLLLNHIADPAMEAQQLLLPVHLVYRMSSGIRRTDTVADEPTMQ